MKKSAKLLLLGALILVVALAALGIQRWVASRGSHADDLLGLLLRDMCGPGTSGDVGGDVAAILYLDVAQLRQAPFAQKLLAWAPQPAADPEYTRFVAETSFNYERDLDRAAFGVSRRGQRSIWLAIVDGSFDQKKITAYLAKNGTTQKRNGYDIYSLPERFTPPYGLNPGLNPGPNPGTSPEPASPSPSAVSLAFLSANRIALSNDPDLASLLAQPGSRTAPAEWRSRFARLAGSPIFAVFRQDANTAHALAAQAPGGLQSPQLSALLAQLTWLTLAAQPDADSLRLVLEGENPNATVARQLADMLNGVVILAEAGLNDAKMRQQLDPRARAAYLALLQSADIARVDREDMKAVRVVLRITPDFLDAANLPRPSAPTPAPQPAPPAKNGKHPAHASQ